LISRGEIQTEQRDYMTVKRIKMYAPFGDTRSTRRQKKKMSALFRKGFFKEGGENHSPEKGSGQVH